MKRLFMTFAAVAVSFSMVSCEEEEDLGTGIRPEAPFYTPKDCVFERYGLKNESSDDTDKYWSFQYTGYAPYAEKPVNVYFYIPELTENDDIKTMPVLFALTGAEREGNTQLDAWKTFADRYRFVVINPQFTSKYYSENDYQFGSVTTSKNSGVIRDKGYWTYNIIEALFSYWLKETDGEQEGYRLFGHSAGAQFVGRMMMVMPEARVIRAVAANPSSWAWPFEDGLKTEDGTKVFGWPYSIKDTGTDLAAAFQKNLYIQIGTKDVETESLDTSEAANLQGSRRYDRAKNFYQTCMELAEEKEITCNFKLAEVENVGHSTWHMVYGYPKPTASKVEKEQLGSNSAYLLLFD